MGIVPSEQIIHLVSDADSQLCCVTGLVRRHQLLVQEYGGQSAHFRRDRNVLQASRKTDAFLLIAIDAIAEFLLRDDRTKELEPSPLRVPPIASRHPSGEPIDVRPVVMQSRNNICVEIDRGLLHRLWSSGHSVTDAESIFQQRSYSTGLSVVLSNSFQNSATGFPLIVSRVLISFSRRNFSRGTLPISPRKPILFNGHWQTMSGSNW